MTYTIVEIYVICTSKPIRDLPIKKSSTQKGALMPNQRVFPPMCLSSARPLVISLSFSSSSRRLPPFLSRRPDVFPHPSTSTRPRPSDILQPFPFPFRNGASRADPPQTELRVRPHGQFPRPGPQGQYSTLGGGTRDSANGGGGRYSNPRGGNY